MGKRNKTGLKTILKCHEMYVLQLSDMLFCKYRLLSEKSCVKGIGYLHTVFVVGKEAAEQCAI